MEYQPAPPDPDVIPEPETISSARSLLAKLQNLINGGEVQGVSVYVHHTDGTYRTMQAGSIDRHRDAGILLELAVARLGFIDRETVAEMIEESD